MNDRAVSITKDGIKFLDSNCLFSDCKITSGKGGAINFACMSSIIQRRFCSIGCIVRSEEGAHSYCNLKTNNMNQSFVIESSISNCIESTIYHVLSFYYGITGIYSTNSSKNVVYECPGFQKNYESHECIANFSTFCNNKEGNLVLYHNTGQFKEYMCNFVDNPWSQTLYSMIHLDKGQRLSVENCTILGPYGSTKIFWGPTGTVTVTNCNIDNINQIGNAISKNINQNMITAILSHFSTQKCDAENPLLPDLMQEYISFQTIFYILIHIQLINPLFSF